MGAVLLNGAKIGKNSIVGAGALITEGKEYPENSLIVGAPARAIRTLDAKAAEMLKLAAKAYTDRWPQYASVLERIG
jgi:carbonic anhydrase/acetyltransferase-like protein (isoleucine patch superfamily)